MRQIVRTLQADTDLLEIWLYIARENMERADALLTRIDERCQILRQYPEAGKKRDELIPHIRSLTEGDYQIFYRIMEHRIEVLRIVHGSRDLQRMFREETL